MNKVDEQPNNVTIVVVLVSLVVGIPTTGIPVVYESCWRNSLSAGGGRQTVSWLYFGNLNM
jgi:hypothetical protein